MRANILEFNDVVFSRLHSRQQRDAYGDFVNSEDSPVQSLKMLIGLGFAYVRSYECECM